jgi:hypothetical protein
MEGISIMISPDRLLPQQQIYNFLKSATIKFEPIAQYINVSLMEKGYTVNHQDPRTWKYYLNMVGRYHESDTKMYVTSLDTRKTILFSPQDLAQNLRTRAVYIPGGPYYNRLCELYPDQVDLIKSILFPVSDLIKAIEAPDLTLLNYGSGYLEIHEEPVMVAEVRRFLDVYKERWYFDFLDDEPYFYLTAWGSLWFYLGGLLMTKRMQNIKTPYVHSFDLWSALRSAGLDDYSDILDREKSMMLYQNIDYFKANAGKRSNLNILANRLLKSLGIGLYGRNVVQETETGADRFQLTPQLVPVLLSTDTDSPPAKIEIKSVATVQSEVFAKGLTPSNSAEEVAAIERQLGDTRLNTFATKFLEIKPIAQHKPYAETLNVFLIETLTLSIARGYYKNPVEVIDPLTDNAIYLPPSELLALYHYAVQKSMGIESDSFPTIANFYTSFDTEIPKPQKIIKHFGRPLYLSMQLDIDAYMADLTYDENILNPQEFSDNVTKLWLRFMAHRLADQNSCEGKLHEAQAYLSSLCHTRREESIELVTGYSGYDEWLGGGGIDITSTIFSQYTIQPDPMVHWGNLADAIISILLPLNDTLRIFGNFTFSNSGYERLRQLFVQMCSYRVVFLESERDTPEFVVGPKWLNYYGPDHIRTYGDFIVATTMDASDAINVDIDTQLNPGFHLDTSISMTQPSLVGKQTISGIVETLAQTYTEPARILVETTLTNQMHSPIAVAGSRLHIEMVEP